MSKTALRRILTAGAALAAATPLGAAPAHAAPTPGTVKLTGTHVEFIAGAGPTNDISAAGTMDPIFGFIDKNNVRLDPSARKLCEQFTANSVRCTGITFATFSLGDKSDATDQTADGNLGSDTCRGNDVAKKSCEKP
jgi:hypothetical protein